MKRKYRSSFFNLDFYRGFVNVLSFRFIGCPPKKNNSYQRIKDEYFRMGSKGIAHDFQMFLDDNEKCAEAYNKSEHTKA